MPASRFDTSQQYDYVSSRVPLPFDVIAGLGEKAKQDYTSGQAAEAELGTLGQAIKAAPMHEAHRAKFINEFDNKAKALVEKYHNNYGDPGYKLEVSKLITEFKNRPEINAFAGTLESFNNWQKAKLAGKSKDLDYTYEMEDDGKTFKQKNVLSEGVYSNRITKYYDWDQAAKEAAGHMAASGADKVSGLNLSDTKLEGGKLYERTKTGWRGVTNAKAQDIAKTVIPNYASKEAGQHHLETILRENYQFGNNAYNVTYTDIANKASLAQDRINKGTASEDDQKIIDMKNDIDDKLYNHIYGANKHQIGVITDKSVQEHIMADPKGSGSGNDDEPNGPKNPWNLYAPNANPDPNNPVASALHKANPNSVFTVESNGNIKDVKAGDVGKKVVFTYTDKSGNKWNLDNLPKGWTKVKDLWNGDYIISSGGTKIPINEMKPERHEINNIDIYAKQVNEVLQWAAATNQFNKNKPGSQQYEELLPKYKAAIQNGALNKQYIPQFDAETAANFKDVFAPKVTYDQDNNQTIKDPGLTSNWVIEGVSSNAEKTAILNDFNPIGLDMVKGGDNILISSGDGKEYSVNMNNPTLRNTFNKLSTFIQDNNKAKLNPTSVDPQQVELNASAMMDRLNTKFKNLAVQEKIDPALVENNLLYVANSYKSLSSGLTSNGYVPTSSYEDPTTGTIAVSFINHALPHGQDVQVVKYHPGVDNSFEMTSEASFNREVQQKAFGNFASNLNKKGSKTAGSFIENQNPKP